MKIDIKRRHLIYAIKNGISTFVLCIFMLGVLAPLRGADIVGYILGAVISIILLAASFFYNLYKTQRRMPWLFKFEYSILT